jgi:AraC family transcriptional activator FtrA
VVGPSLLVCVRSNEGMPQLWGQTAAIESGIIAMVRDIPANPANGANGAALNVAIVVYPGFTPFELGVACEVLGDDRWVAAGEPWYRLFICGDTSRPVTADGGFQILVPYGLDQLTTVGTIIVSPTYRPGEVPAAVFDALRGAHARGCRILSLCGGAFVLAESGLLDGRRAATHWAECDELARRYPLVTVDPGVLYADEGDILTGAGSAASIDLCLHIVRQDFGSQVATQLARQLVVPPQRKGGQAQFIEHPLPTLDSSTLFADTVAWVQEHLDEPGRVEDLAARSAMSPRTFARHFLAATGTTPYQWLVRQRVHLAQRLLEVTDLSIDTVAERSGFCTAGNLRKHFARGGPHQPAGLPPHLPGSDLSTVRLNAESHSQTERPLDRPGHVARLGRSQECDHPGNLGRLGPSIHEGGGPDGVGPLGRLHRRLHRTGRDGVDPHAGRAELGRPGPGE